MTVDRQPDLPADMVCDACGDVITNSEPAIQLTAGMNALGDFRAYHNPQTWVICRECLPHSLHVE